MFSELVGHWSVLHFFCFLLLHHITVEGEIIVYPSFSGFDFLTWVGLDVPEFGGVQS